MKRGSVAERLQKEFVWLLVFGFFCLSACAASQPTPPDAAETDSKGAQTQAQGQTEESPLLLPQASGTVVYEEDGVIIDASHTDQGYVMIRCEPSAKRLKARISTPLQTYYYDLPGGEAYSVFPLQMGDGVYTVRVMEQVESDLYAVRYSVELQVALADETLPFLYPNQYVWYDADTKTVQKARELARGLTSHKDIADRFYEYVVSHMTYDTAKANTVENGYLPSADDSLESGTGICFDYAGLLAVMLRAEGIPAKVLIGTVTPENLYHAWNSVYLDGVWVWMDTTLDGTGHKERDYTAERFY
ncbi:MAG: transglutaminase-like domain-containing protein [Christensenella sp.]|nr:transglutaminase-like domain-containing protein [Christensenella sp.]